MSVCIQFNVFCCYFCYYFLLNFICYAIYKYVAVAAAATGTLIAYVGKTSAHTYKYIHCLYISFIYKHLLIHIHSQKKNECIFIFNNKLLLVKVFFTLSYIVLYCLLLFYLFIFFSAAATAVVVDFFVILVADCCFYNTFDKCMRELAYIILSIKKIFINNKNLI